MITAIAAADDDGREPGGPPGYEILDEVGRGGLSVVYRARQLSLGRTVAIRTARPNTVSGLANTALLREAAILGQLAHPNIVPVIDLIQHAGRDYLVLKYIERTLADLLVGDQPLSQQHAIEVATTLAESLGHVHARGITHANLKPRKVLLDTFDTVYLSGFEVAIDDARRAEMASVPGVIVGTPAYMAPEQARGQFRDIGPPSDVWALGAVLYEMLTGRPPFRANTTIDVMMAVVERDPEPVRKLNRAVSRGLEAVCARCLQKNPAKRYETMAALAAALDGERA